MLIHTMRANAFVTYRLLEVAAAAKARLLCVSTSGIYGDPLRNLPPPALPALPQKPIQITGNRQIPNGCPGSSNPASYAALAVCQFLGQYKNTFWRLYPGLYPGAMQLQGGTFYFEPGIY